MPATSRCDVIPSAARFAARDAELLWRGFTVLRFRNDEVHDAMDGVMIEVLAALGAVEKPMWDGE
jgi:very-short-patch-repair endonuclease